MAAESLIAAEFERFHLEEHPVGRPLDFADGLIEALRRAGYEIAPIPTPCPTCGLHHPPPTYRL